MTIDDQIKDEKLQLYQYDINREAAKIWVLSSGKINKVEEILLSNKKEKLLKNKEKQLRIKNRNKSELLKEITPMKMNYCCQKKNKYLRLDTIEELSNKVDYGNLKFIAKSSGNETDYTEVEGPIDFLNNIRTNKIARERVKNLQEEFNGYLKKRIGKKCRTTTTKKRLANTNMSLKRCFQIYGRL